MRRTPFYERHKALGARLVEFAGWEMPVQYRGIVEEHNAVRNACGLFDVSHMGEIFFTGKDSFAQIQKLITNDLAKISEGKALYSPMCNKTGGIVDDLIVYKFSEAEYLIVVNASNVEKDFKWMQENTQGVELTNRSDEYGQLALQGPNAEGLLSKITDANLGAIGKFCFSKIKVAGAECIAARTGYTGEDGFELYMGWENGPKVWDAIVDEGKNFNLQPVGLGARDTLRLEAGLMLYGNDIDDDTTPLEAPLKWTVATEKEFIGKEGALKPLRKKMVGFELKERGVPRHGNSVIIDGKEAGVVTSGTFSPTLKKPIGLCFVPPGHPKEKGIGINIHGKVYDAVVSTTRFYRRDAK